MPDVSGRETLGLLLHYGYEIKMLYFLTLKRINVFSLIYIKPSAKICSTQTMIKWDDITKKYHFQEERNKKNMHICTHTFF